MIEAASDIGGRFFFFVFIQYANFCKDEKNATRRVMMNLIQHPHCGCSENATLLGVLLSYPHSGDS